MELRLIIMAIVCLSLAQVVFASPDNLYFANQEEEQRFYRLSSEFHCNDCHNQSVAESNSPHAIDMRTQIYQMMIKGDSDQAIRSFLSYRYGQKVLYNADFHYRAWLLWFGPVVVLIAAVWFAMRFYRCMRV